MTPEAGERHPAGPRLAADERGDPRPPGHVSPWWVLAVFGLVAVAGGILRLPAPVAAGILLALFGIAVARHPANGLAAIPLASGFLLGEHKTPYFVLPHVAVLGVLLSFLAHRLLGRIQFVPRYPGAALLFVAAAVMALPLNLRDLMEDLWLFRAHEWGRMLVSGIPDISHLKYVERVGVLGLGAALVVVASQPQMAVGVLGSLRPLAWLSGTLAAFGLLRFFGVIRTSGQYLTLSFWTWENPDLRLTAVAWNPDYFAQFLVLVIPIALSLAGAATSAWPRVAMATAAATGALALLLTFQRAAYASLVVALGVLAILASRAGLVGTVWVRRVVVIGALGLLGGALLDVLVLGGRVAERLGRFVDDPNRLRLWGSAVAMFAEHPLLGVGTGRYAFFFHEYAGEAGRDLGPFWGTAHSTYLHVAAEQGLVGLASFGLLFGTAWWAGARGLHRRGTARQPMLLSGLLAALAGWLAYGVFQFTFRVHALTYLVCVLTGAVVALAPREGRVRVPRRWRLVAVGVALVVLAVRAEAALRRPVSPGYEAGFYRWERQADGLPARWTRGRAAMTVPVRGPVMQLRFRAPIPNLAARPQEVRVRIDRQLVRTLRLADPGWHGLEVPVRVPAGARVLLEVEVTYTVVPSRASASRDDRELGVMMGQVTWRDA